MTLSQIERAPLWYHAKREKCTGTWCSLSLWQQREEDPKEAPWTVVLVCLKGIKAKKDWQRVSHAKAFGNKFVKNKYTNFSIDQNV